MEDLLTEEEWNFIEISKNLTRYRFKDNFVGP